TKQLEVLGTEPYSGAATSVTQLRRRLDGLAWLRRRCWSRCRGAGARGRAGLGPRPRRRLDLTGGVRGSDSGARHGDPVSRLKRGRPGALAGHEDACAGRYGDGHGAVLDVL